jgi:hypothetical protein
MTEEKEHLLSRRQFFEHIRGNRQIIERTAGSILVGIGAADGYATWQKDSKAYEDARRELEGQGAHRPYEKALKSVREDAAKHETLDKELLDRQREVFTHASEYDKIVKQRHNEKVGSHMRLRLVSDLTAVVLGGMLTLRRRKEGNKEADAPAQNEK